MSDLTEDEDLTEIEISDLTKYSELEKYIFDPFYEHRYVKAASNGLTDIARDPGKPGPKAVSKTESLVSGYSFFEENKEKMRQDYLDRLTSSVISEEKVLRFIKIIAEFWYDGRPERTTSDDIWEIKKSIRNYCIERTGGTKFAVKDENRDIKPLFETYEMGHLLKVTHEMFDHYMQDYLQSRQDYLENSSNRIYIHRGIRIDELLSEGDYYEYDYINSYSLAQSVPEQFTAIARNGKFRTMIGGCVNDFSDQILAFAPFIPGMNIQQLELCIIPGIYPLRVRYDGEYSGINEYTLSDPRGTGSFKDLIDAMAKGEIGPGA
jgi:hypothetical protein